MKVLKFATLILAFSGSSWLFAGGDSFDLDRIQTLNGRAYEEILILSSDRHGLLFRHKRGIAKINFNELSMNLRMLYEPVEETPMETAVDETDDSFSLLEEESITITAANRITVPLGYYRGLGWNRCNAYRCAYPIHWPRYSPALRLAIPECRALAVEDFLITTGLVPRPFGVRTYRLPYNYADLRY